GRGLVADAHEREAAIVRRVRHGPKPSPRTAESTTEPAPLRQRRDRDQHDQRSADQNQSGNPAMSHQYPSRSVPSFVPFTDPWVSHSSDARKSRRRFFSHIALCEEHARSTNNFFGVARSA